MDTYQGIRIFDGISIGKIKYLNFDSEIEESFGAGKDIETKRFKIAQERAIKDTEELYKEAKEKLSSKNADIINAHVEMLQDLDFIDLVNESIQKGYTAEYSTYSAGKKLANMFANMTDSYMKERADDVREIYMQIVNILRKSDSKINLTEPVIIVADDIPTSALLKMNKKYLQGLVLLKTSTNAHIAILARTMEIPSIASVEGDFDQKNDGRLAILDGGKGKLIVNYPSDALAEYVNLQKSELKARDELKKYIGKKAVTKDGKTIKINANISSAAEVDVALKNDAEGIGLFRSEFIYLSASDYPTEDDQFERYKSVVEIMKDRETVIRTLDIGADKKVDYFDLPKENNPALGYRSIRICQDRNDVFLTQLQALYRASAYGNLSIMIPMIISESEIDFVLNMCELAKANLKSRKLKFNPDTRIGIMIETPAAVIMSDVFAKKVDFFSIGTNDLSQYTLAIDRQNQKLNKFFNPHHRAILRSIKSVTNNAHKAGIPVAICGELARDPELTGFFMKVGVDELSVSSPYILRLKANIDELNTEDVDISKFID
ncbi:MAG: phosphoenolpyruvate--protein phosphotransferase [Bacilli bacterium]